MSEQQLAAVLIDNAVRSGVILTLGAVLGGVLHARSAALRHWVWVAAIVSVLVLPIVTWIAPVWQPRVGMSAIDAHLSLPEKLRFAETGVSGDGSALAPGSAVLERMTLPRVSARTKGAGRLWLIALWACGALVGLVRIWRDVIAAQRVRLCARRVTGGAALETLHALAASDVVILQSEQIGSPATFGFVCPVIMIPADLRAGEHELRALLAHEIAHVRRRDGLTQLLARASCALYWFNPLAWYAAHRLTLERERACDDAALASGIAPHEYARMLLDVARDAMHCAALPAGALAIARTSQLEARVVAILSARVRRGAPSLGVRVLVCALTLLVILPVAALRFYNSARADVPREPDLAGDSLASPLSERIALSPAEWRAAETERASLAGPDSMLSHALHEALQHPPQHPADFVRERAAWALAHTQNGEITTPMLALLRDNDWRVRAYAAWVLAQSHDARATPALLPLLEHPVWRLRAMATFALAALADTRASAAMTRALIDDAWQVRASAVDYFAAINGDPALVRPRLRDRHIAVRVAAERALAQAH